MSVCAAPLRPATAFSGASGMRRTSAVAGVPGTIMRPGGYSNLMDRREAEQAVGQLLLEHIARDRYPSSTQMDMLEQSLTPDLASGYFAVLFDKVRDDNFPSLDLLHRIQRVAAQLPRAG